MLLAELPSVFSEISRALLRSAVLAYIGAAGAGVGKPLGFSCLLKRDAVYK